MSDMSSANADVLQYMQTVGDNTENKETADINEKSSANFTSVIDPPRKSTTGRNYSFESDDDILLTSDDDDVDYRLSTSSSSDDETIPTKQTRSSLMAKNNLTPSTATLHKNNAASGGNDATMTSSNLNQVPKKEDSQPIQNKAKTSSFMDVLNDIMKEDIEIPSKSVLGPKPWLMRQSILPRPTKKYEVSNEPFIYKPKPQIQTVTTHAPPAPAVEQDTLQQSLKPEDMYDTPPSRGRVSSASSGDAISEGKRSTKYPSEADTGFCSNASSNPSPSNSSANISRLPSSEEKPTINNSNAQELAKAAIQALSLSKNILQDMEKDKNTPGRNPDTIYDEVPISPMTSEKRNVYDDVPAPIDVITGRPCGKRKVISVPVFKPPPAPLRNDKNNVISSEPIYDISRQQPQQNVSSGAMDLMYQLFGKEATGYGQYSRPASVKSVTFEDEVRAQDDVFPSRPSSRAGSICSEWSDCTLNMSEYPESVTSTLPRSTVEFPKFPQIGFSELNPQGFQNNQPMPFHPPNNQNMLPSNSNFGPQMNPNVSNPYNNNIMQPPQVFPPNSDMYQTPNNIPYNPRIPIPPLHSQRFPFQNQPLPDIRRPIYGGNNPYGPYPPMGPQGTPYPQTRMPSLSPPKKWGSPQREFHGAHRHHHNEHMHRHGRVHSRNRGRGRRRGRSNSRLRRNRYSDEEESQSPSPVRNQRRDVMVGKSYLDGYKAALKDAVTTFAEKQGLGAIANAPKVDTKEERMHRNLRRALSSGKIHELPDNVELGDIRKAFKFDEQEKYSDDEIDDVIDSIEDFIIPSTGRPQSKSNRRQPRYCRDDDVMSHSRRYRDDDDFINDQQYSSYSEHGSSCDCSECEEQFEMEDRYHHGEMMSSRTRQHDVMNHQNRQANEEARPSPKMNGLRQRYMESLETSSGNTRAPVRANHTHPQGGDTDPRNFQTGQRRQNDVENFQPQQQNMGYTNGGRGGHQVYPGQRMTYNQGQCRNHGFQNEWERGKRVQFGYQ